MLSLGTVYTSYVQFRVEKENGANPAPIDMDIDPKGDNDNGGNTGEEDGFSSEKN